MLHRALCAAVVSALIGVQAPAQVVISAQAGLVYYTEGRVFLNQEALVSRASQYPQIKKDDIFSTGRGRAEILLSPGVFLRLGPHTSVRLLASEITVARIELVSGEVVLEAVDLNRVNGVTLTLGKMDIRTSKKGQYHLAANPPGLRVFSGKAVATSGGGQRLEVTRGSEARLDDAFIAREFNPLDTDALDRWSERRSRLLAKANNELLMKEALGSKEFDFSAELRTSGPDASERTRPQGRRGVRGIDR